MPKPLLEGKRPEPNPDPNAPAEQIGPVTGEPIIKQLIGHFGAFKIIVVDDAPVKKNYDGDFTEGGNPAAYWFVPLDEIWIAVSIIQGRRIFTAFHEVTENLDMSPPEKYHDAHPWGNTCEFMIRYFTEALLEGKSAEEAEQYAFTTHAPIEDPQDQPLAEEPQHPEVAKEDKPMPEPKENESEQDFVSRCVPIVMGEGDDQDAALGKCYGIYRNATKAMGTVDTMADASLEKFNDAEKAQVSPAVRRAKMALSAVVKTAIMAAIIQQTRKSGMAVDPVELYEGTCEEMEHTPDWHQAMQIAMDHLSETPDYYTQLKSAGLAGSDCNHEPLDVDKGLDAKGAVGIGDVQAEETEKDAATTLSSCN